MLTCESPIGVAVRRNPNKTPTPDPLSARGQEGLV